MRDSFLKYFKLNWISVITFSDCQLGMKGVNPGMRTWEILKPVWKRAGGYKWELGEQNDGILPTKKKSMHICCNLR